jgi:hypothetical protein
MSDKKSQSPIATVWHLREINFQQFSHLEGISHEPGNTSLQYHTSLTTHFFSPSPKLTKYNYKYYYKYRYKYMYGIGSDIIQVQ